MGVRAILFQLGKCSQWFLLRNSTKTTVQSTIPTVNVDKLFQPRLFIRQVSFWIEARHNRPQRFISTTVERRRRAGGLTCHLFKLGMEQRRGKCNPSRLNSRVF